MVLTVVVSVPCALIIARLDPRQKIFIVANLLKMFLNLYSVVFNENLFKYALGFLLTNTLKNYKIDKLRSATSSVLSFKLRSTVYKVTLILGHPSVPSSKDGF